MSSILKVDQIQNTDGQSALVIASDGSVNGVKYAEAASPSGRTITSTTMSSYEEGTFTPLFRTSASSTDIGSNYTNRVGEYIKVGKLVYFSFDMEATIGSTSGNVCYIGGLPFISAASDPVTGIPTVRNCTCVTIPSGSILKAFIVQSSNAMHLQSEVLTSGATTNISVFNSSGRANMCGSYITDE